MNGLALLVNSFEQSDARRHGMGSSEFLVVLSGPHSAGAVTGLEVVHQVSPTVMIVRRLPPEIDELRVRYAGVDPPPEIIDALDDGERLFVEGWLARRSATKTDRPGEGLAWDAPGMTPPDLPPADPDCANGP
jgi:hypothetical protein